jgi:hypothetical protein
MQIQVVVEDTGRDLDLMVVAHLYIGSWIIMDLPGLCCCT